MNYRCILCQNQKDIVNHFHVRHEVFVDEIEIPFDYETNEADITADLFLVYNEHDVPIGAGRFRVADDIGIVERICVIRNYRNQGIGELIMQTIEKHAITKGVKTVQLSAQLRALSFYKRLMYEPFGKMFFELGIEHKKMHKTL